MEISLENFYIDTGALRVNMDTKGIEPKVSINYRGAYCRECAV